VFSRSSDWHVGCSGWGGQNTGGVKAEPAGPGGASNENGRHTERDEKEYGMIRRNVFVMALGAALLMAADAHAGPRDDIQAPRAQDVQAPRGDNEDLQAPRGENEDLQAPRGDNEDLQAPRGSRQDAPAPRG
jgi:hypothetical protein